MLEDVFDAAASHYRVDASLLRSLADRGPDGGGELLNDGNLDAVGIMRFTPQTARRLGVNPLDPVQAIFGAAAEVRANLDRFDGSYERALAAYNTDVEAGARGAGPQVREVRSRPEQHPSEPDPQVITSARAWHGAGGGRGSVSGPRLDTDKGRRELAVEQEMSRLEAINPIGREKLRALAEFNVTQPAIPVKAVDREAQYAARGYAPANAAANARYDAALEQRLNERTQRVRPDTVTGERIAQSYNPNSERERVAAEEKEMYALRADARQRAAAQEMPAVVRGMARGAGELYALGRGAAGLAGELTDSESLRDWGLEGYLETMRGVNNIRLAPTFTGIRSTGDALEWALENSGYAGFQAATTILSAGMGGLIANTVGKKALGEAVGIALNSTVQTFGSVYGEAVEEARRTGQPLDLPKMLAGATVSTAIDTLADRIGLNALSTQTFKGNALERLGKSVGTQMAVQGGTEAAQRVPEELGAGREPFREGAGAQYVDDFAAGALFGAHAGAVGGLRGGEPKGAPAQHGAHRADVPVVGERHTTPMPPVHAEQASVLPED